MLYDRTLFGDIDKVKIAVDRLRAFEPPQGYYFAFSGGKDSVALYHLMKMSGAKHDIHFNVTTIDPPDLTYFIRDNFKDVHWVRPDQPFLIKMLKKGFPLRQVRWCCEYLKERQGEGRIVVTGIRWEESPRRRKRRMTERCTLSGGKHYFHPIIDWTEEDVWEFHKAYNLPHCNLYDKGLKRIGCLFCPNSTHEEKMIYKNIYPRYYKLFEYYFIKLYNSRQELGNKSVARWTSGKDMFEWWIAADRGKTDSDQISLFG